MQIVDDLERQLAVLEGLRDAAVRLIRLRHLPQMVALHKGLEYVGRNHHRMRHAHRDLRKLLRVEAGEDFLVDQAQTF